MFLVTKSSFTSTKSFKLQLKKITNIKTDTIVLSQLVIFVSNIVSRHFLKMIKIISNLNQSYNYVANVLFVTVMAYVYRIIIILFI